LIYRPYGSTDAPVSLLGFGGMRFADPDDRDGSIRTMLAAAAGGVNYFDTAPAYFGTKSEEIFGAGLAEFRRRGLPYYVATKTFKSKPADIRAEIEGQLRRLDVPAIDFYHVWCITALDQWRGRVRDGALDAFRELKEEGLIRHICVSSHLIGDEIKELLMEGVFEGVLFGYSAFNFKTRDAAFDAVRAKGLGAVVMNPLGGGLVPEHPELFGFLRRPGDADVVQSALRFLWDHPDISSTLVGFRNEADVAAALAAMEGYSPRTAAELAAVKAGAAASFEGLCTGCGYCDDCPQGIPVPKYMDAYNLALLPSGGAGSAAERGRVIADRLKWHWNLKPDGAAACVECGQCEQQCTQHLDIVRRLNEIAGKET
jgi:predicted aldo/keto reductase-like oxidoreductase